MTMDPAALLDTMVVQDPEGVLPYITINQVDFNPEIHIPLQPAKPEAKPKAEAKPAAKAEAKPAAKTSKVKATEATESQTGEAAKP